MGLSDPFSTTYEGSRQALGAYGQALQQTAQSFAQRQEQERRQKRQVLGAMLGHFISEGYISPSPELLKNIQSEFPELGGLQAGTPTDISKQPVKEGYERTYKYGKLGKLEGFEDKPIDPIKIEEEKRKSKEETRKEQEFPLEQAGKEATIKEKRISAFRKATGREFLKGMGQPIEDIAREDLQKQQTAKLPFPLWAISPIPQVRNMIISPFMKKPSDQEVQNYIDKTSGIPLPKLGQTQQPNEFHEFHEFPDEESAKKANLPHGSKVRIGGKDYIWQVD